MNIKILDSWLREHLKTSAKPEQVAEKLSLSSVSIEHIEKYKDDYVYDIEITTNRPDLMSVTGIAKEAATLLPQSGIDATYRESRVELPKDPVKNGPEILIKNDPNLVRRICAVIMEVTIKDSPHYIKDRLEASGIRVLNNVIDVTNYVMREIGHPTHVFDYDRLTTHKLIIRESKKGEKIRTLDDKEYTLSGKDIVADNDKGEIVDLLGVMGTANSVVTNSTKRILYFIDTVEPTHIRKTSMEHGIRTEAAVLNEKGINPSYAEKALAVGIALFKKVADAKIVSDIIDIYPEKSTATTIIITEEKINTVVGVAIPLKKSVEILKDLGFSVEQKETTLKVTVPPEKSGEDMKIAEDLIEEIARIYGYHNIPNTLPAITSTENTHIGNNEFFWEDKIRDALKYWGFTEVYTYPMVSNELSVKPVENAVEIQNPLTEEFVYMRRSLIPSLLKVAKENSDHDPLMLFEIANVYEKNGRDLPKQLLRLAGLIRRKPHGSFLEVKGIIEQLLIDIGIEDIKFKQLTDEKYGAAILIDKNELGIIEILDDTTIDFELDLEMLLTKATLTKIYKPISKYPPVVEDMAIIAPANVLTGDIIEVLSKQHSLIAAVSLLDKYQDTRTFHIVYQSFEKNLTNEDITPIREKIIKTVKEKLHARIKE